MLDDAALPALPGAAFLETPADDVALPHVRRLQLPREQTMDFCWIPPGSCRVGSRDRNADERPVHKLVVHAGYWLGRTVVTRGQYHAIVGSVPEWRFPGVEATDQHPVVDVSWFDALYACRSLHAHCVESAWPVVGPAEAFTDERHQEVRWSDEPGLRLPTELEWEYACRGAGRLHRGLVDAPFGDGEEVLDRMAWFDNTSQSHLHSVEDVPDPDLLPHPLGLLQMMGNVDEWCLDLYWAEASRSRRPRRGRGGHGRRADDAATIEGRQDASAVVRAAKRGDLPKEAVKAVLSFPSLESLQQALDREFGVGRALRVLRGGSWYIPAWRCRSADRNWGGPGDRYRFQGFRACLFPGPRARAAEPSKQA